MAEVMTEGPVLSDSTFKTRPHFRTYLRYDSGGTTTAVDDIENHRRERQMKFPSLVGRKEPDSMKTPQNLTDPAYKKWNEEGDHRPAAPYRSCDNIIDPVSGFVSVAGDQDRNTGHSYIPSMVQLNDTPQSRTPQGINSVCAGESAAPLETQRTSEKDSGMPYSWNSRQMSDATIRSALGGWTSDVDPRTAEENMKPFKAPADPNKSLRDKLAHRYVYTSSTQRTYEQVPWDNVLKSKQYPPISTLEERADMISQRYEPSSKRYEAQAEDWQTLGRSWDWFQTRRGHYKQDIPVPGVVFCSPCPRTGHIPLYGGCVGAENLDEIDNRKEPFTPFTMKRNPLPWPTETSHRPNIPKYDGCTWYRPDTVPANSMPTEPMSQTHRIHRPLYVGSNDSAYRRGSRMSRMMTTVPPGNPFTKDLQPAERLAVKTS